MTTETTCTCSGSGADRLHTAFACPAHGPTGAGYDQRRRASDEGKAATLNGRAADEIAVLAAQLEKNPNLPVTPGQRVALGYRQSALEAAARLADNPA